MPFHLVLEGGAMRGLFTAGVLDYLLEQGILAARTIGVSGRRAGGLQLRVGCFGPHRLPEHEVLQRPALPVGQQHTADRDALGIDFTFDKIPRKLDPFDMGTIYRSP